jgi:DNA-binding PadR family transcriptional regulator
MLALADRAGDELSGYDLKSWTDTSVGYFWSAAKSQIYAVLARLSERGLIVARRFEQVHRPDKNLYRITESGKQALDRWLAQPLPSTPGRNVFLLRVFFGNLGSKDAVIADIEAYVEEARTLRRELEELDAESRISGKMNVYYSITREYGFALTDMIESWAERAVRDLRRADADGWIAVSRRRPRKAS